MVGYEVIIEGLTAEESILVQEHGLGANRPHTVLTGRQTAWEQTGDLAECDLTLLLVYRMPQPCPPD